MHFQCHTFKNPVKTKNKHFLMVIIIICTVSPGSSDPFHIVSYTIQKGSPLLGYTVHGVFWHMRFVNVATPISYVGWLLIQRDIICSWADN